MRVLNGIETTADENFEYGPSSRHVKLSVRDSGFEFGTISCAILGNKNISLTMQLIRIDQNTTKEWICDIRPNINSIEELGEAKLTLQDLSLIDPLRSNMLELLMRESLQQELLGALREQYE